MELIIKEVYEYMNSLRVVVEHQYGEDNIGLSLKSQKLHPETGEPAWKKEVKELMTKKYGGRDKNNKIIKKPLFKEQIGKKMVI